MHTRPATPEVVERVIFVSQKIAIEFGLYFIIDGTVLDLTVEEPAKGQALEQLRARLGVSAALYAGDAESDEKAIAILRGPDLGLHVGAGDTTAAHTIPDPESFAHVLALLFELRRAWLFGEDAVGAGTAFDDWQWKLNGVAHPPGREGLLDEPPLAGLRVNICPHSWGGEPAGHFSIEPVKASQVLAQRYVDNTMIVETRWADVTVTDYLEPAPEGITSLVRVLSGTGTARVVFAPRPDYANAPFSMEIRGGDEVHIMGTSDPIILSAPGVQFRISSDGKYATATAEVPLHHGPVVLNLRCGDTEPLPADPAGGSQTGVPASGGLPGSGSRHCSCPPSKLPWCAAPPWC